MQSDCYRFNRAVLNSFLAGFIAFAALLDSGFVGFFVQLKAGGADCCACSAADALFSVDFYHRKKVRKIGLIKLFLFNT